MKKVLLSIVSLLSAGFYLTSAKIALAADTLCPPNFANLCNIRADKAGSLVSGIISMMLILAVIVALFFLVWGGIRWTMSGGDQAKVQAARSTIIASIVGLVIAFLAFFIVSFVLYFFTGQGLGNFSLPTLV